MTKHAEKASQLFRQGYNCAQAVLTAFCDETGLDEETSVKLASSFGGGMGRLREVCGAMTAAFMVVGIKYGYTSPESQEQKADHYQLIQDIAARFKEKNLSIICRELLDLSETHSIPMPDRRTEQYYADRPCEKFVSDAAEILDNIIAKNNQIN
jgi:C_GCAxxG_C_C family probable redox protein